MRTPVANAVEAATAKLIENTRRSRLQLVEPQQPGENQEKRPKRTKKPAVIDIEATVMPGGAKESVSDAAPLTLEECEAIIREGVKWAFKAGDALLQIREKRLYEKTHRTFGEYVRERFDIERSHAHRWMEAARVLTNLSPIGDMPKPTSESQVRPLVRLEPGQQVEAWKHAVSSSSGGRLTAKHVQASVNSLFSHQSPLPGTPIRREANASSTDLDVNGEPKPDVEGNSNAPAPEHQADKQPTGKPDYLSEALERVDEWAKDAALQPDKLARDAHTLLKSLVEVLTTADSTAPAPHTIERVVKIVAQFFALSHEAEE